MENYFTLIVVNAVFLAVILHSLSKKKNIIIPAKTMTSKKVILIGSSIAIIGLTIYLGNTWYFLATGLMGSVAFVLSSIFDGITKKGIQIRRSLLISTQPWSGIKRVDLKKEDDFLKLDYTGNVSSRLMFFENEDYNRLLEILDENLKDKIRINISK